VKSRAETLFLPKKTSKAAAVLIPARVFNRRRPDRDAPAASVRKECHE
jgi:hypothetical protein